jgi:GPH family glycoside/pentoside/hexuronide:cation symporter
MTDARPLLRPLRRRDLALFASPCLALAGIGLPLTAFLPTYYASELGLNLSAVGLAFMVVRGLDIGLDPLLGLLMDRTRTPWGRFRPWLAAGSPVMMLAVGLLFFARRGVGPAYLTLGLLVAYAGWSICVLAQTAWGALLSADYHERSRVYSWWQTFNIIGLLLILLLPVAAARFGFSTPRDGMVVMGAVLIALFPLTTILAISGVREPARDAAAPFARLRDWLALARLDAVRRVMAVDLVLGLSLGMQASLFLFYFSAVKDMSESAAKLLLLIYFLAALAGSPIWTMLARRIDKHRALALSCLVYVLGLAGLYLFPAASLGWAVAAAAFAGLPYSAASLLSRSMMADAGDEERLDSGVDRTGLLYAVLNSTTKVGAALAVGTTFIGLDLAGFSTTGAHNTPEALAGLSILFLAGPALLNLVAAAMLAGYPLTLGRHAEIRAALEFRALAPIDHAV